MLEAKNGAGDRGPGAREKLRSTSALFLKLFEKVRLAKRASFLRPLAAGLWPLLFLFFPSVLPAALPSCSNTPAWSPCEIVFELSPQAASAHAEAYASVELRADVRSPAFHTIPVPAFWDGGRRMVLRLAPTMAGAWEYQLTSNIAEWDGKTGSFTAVDSESPGFVQTANMHHWATSARTQPHLWMAAAVPGLAVLDDAAFQALADARAAEKFNHLRGLVLEDGPDGAFTFPGHPNLAFFQRLDDRIRYLNQKGITADLTIAADPAVLLKVAPNPASRRRLVSFLVGRYAAFNVTWQVLGTFEDYPDARALAREMGGYLKEMDGYNHPRSSGAKVTSAPLLDDKWMDFIGYGTPDIAVGAIEHQLYQVPAVNRIQAADAAALRSRLWNATMNGQYPEFDGGGVDAAAAAKTMTVWYDFMSGTRHWDLEPYFDVDGGRALALPGVEYIVYVEKAAPVELTVEHHGYDVFWVDPADGTSSARAKYSGEHFTGEPPDRFHDWVLHVVRESTLESMNKSYKFESWPVPVQEIVINPQKIPFDMSKPTGDLTVGQPTACAATMKRVSRATRNMLWMWTAEVTSAGQGYRVLGTSQQGSITVPPGLTQNLPADVLIKLYGINGYGTVYMAAKGYTLKQ